MYSDHNLCQNYNFVDLCGKSFWQAIYNLAPGGGDTGDLRLT